MPTWLPGRLKICFNDHNWLASLLRKRKIEKIGRGSNCIGAPVPSFAQPTDRDEIEMNANSRNTLRRGGGKASRPAVGS